MQDKEPKIKAVEAVESVLTDEQKAEQKKEQLEGLKNRFPAPPQPSRFYRQPVNWQKGAGAMYHMQDKINNLEQQTFHRVALKEVKNALGSRCKHLIHVKNLQGEVSVKAKMDINGTITTFNVDMGEPNPDNWDADTYKSLNDTLKKHLQNVKRG